MYIYIYTLYIYTLYMYIIYKYIYTYIYIHIYVYTKSKTFIYEKVIPQFLPTFGSLKETEVYHFNK